MGLMPNVVWISLFGVMGVLCRYGIDSAFTRANAPFALSTLAINITGSFLAGLIYALGSSKDFSAGLQTGLLIGFCGGFTTFSAYTLQALMMLERGKIVPAFGYLLGSPLLGVVAAFIPVLLLKNFSAPS